MKILIISPDYPPKCGGGGRVAERVATHLAMLGNEVTVIAGTLEYDDIKIEGRDNVKIIWIPLGIRFLRKLIPSIIYSLPPKPKGIFFLLKKIKYDNYDIVHLFAIPTHLLVDIVGIICPNKSIISTIHAFPEYVRNSYIFSILYKMYIRTLGKYLNSKSKIITAVSESTMIEALQNGYPREKLVTIFNGIDYKEIAIFNIKRDIFDVLSKYNITSKDKIILSIGRIVWHKGFEYSIEAFYKVMSQTGYNNLKYIIVGEIIDREYYNKLVSKIKQLGIEENVIFTGYVSENIKYSLLYRADIYVAPSLSEGFGLTLLEAMAFGKPIIATNIKGHRDVIKNGRSGILVTPRNSNAIAEVLFSLLESPKNRKRLSYYGKNQAKMYHWGTIVEKYLQVYKKAQVTR